MEKSLLLKIKKLVEELIEAEENQKIQQEEPPVKLTKELEILKEILFSDKWPESVLDVQIADEESETDKEERAEGICDIILPPNLENKKFLDFGCGEGHVAKHMAKNCSLSVGYDVENNKSNFIWEELNENCMLTKDFEKVKQNGPYDAILIYDVIDHNYVESNLELLSKASSILKDDGKIYMRCHPWTSRHGGHLYRQINKAFVHLVFSEEELKQLGFENKEFIHKSSWPIKMYDELIEQTGLKKENMEIDTQEVESFFHDNPLIKQRLLNSFETQEWKEERPVFQMSQCFIDFVLTKQ